MTVYAKRAALAIAVVSAATSVGCVNSAPPGRVLRVEYTTEPSAQGDVESGVVFWRPTVIGREELPADLMEKLGSTFPIVFQLDGKLANTCFVANAGFGLTSLDRGRTDLRGPLWRTVDAGWTIDFSLQPNGTILGTTGYYFSSGNPAEPRTLEGSYRMVADFSECYEKVRNAPSRPAT
jgi:hypothetical protein